MKVLYIFQYCGHEFYDDESEERLCCSNQCAAMMRTYKESQTRNGLIPVDIFMSDNKSINNEYRPYKDVESIASAIDSEEYDDLYGYDPDVNNLSGRTEIYSEMNSNKENLIILFECKHKVLYTKHRHHPNYDYPLQVELLCRKCHFDRHRDQFRKAFNGTNLELLAVPTANNSIPRAVNAPAEDRAGLAAVL